MRRAVLLAGLALAACTAEEITTTPVVASMARGINPDRLIGQQSLEVRTFRKTAEGRKEVTGVPCTLRAPEFSAKVVTPQRVSLPSFLQGDRFPNRGRPGAVTVTCTDGKTLMAVAFEAHPVNTPAGPPTTVGTPGQPGYGTVSKSVVASNSGSTPWIWGPALTVDLQ